MAKSSQHFSYFKLKLSTLIVRLLQLKVAFASDTCWARKFCYMTSGKQTLWHFTYYIFVNVLERIVSRQLRLPERKWCTSGKMITGKVLTGSFTPQKAPYLKLYSDLNMALANEHVVLLGLLDLIAAFDTIDHDVLLKRLEVSYGIIVLHLTGWSPTLLTECKRSLSMVPSCPRSDFPVASHKDQCLDRYSLSSTPKASLPPWSFMACWIVATPMTHKFISTAIRKKLTHLPRGLQPALTNCVSGWNPTDWSWCRHEKVYLDNLSPTTVNVYVAKSDRGTAVVPTFGARNVSVFLTPTLI